MGVYMSRPIQDKESADFDGKLLKCGASSMQGWRVSQEDAHNCCMDFDEATSLFAVYDGHGGHEVAEYASKHLPNFIKENEAYKAGDYNKALVDAFLQFDASLKTQSVMVELARIAKDGKEKNKDGPGTASGEGGDSDDETDVAKLREEASIPIADVIAMYANNIGLPPKTPKNKLLGLGSSKPMSPFLRAVKPGSSSKDSEVSSSSSAPSSSLTNGVADEPVSSKPVTESSSKPETVGSSKPETSDESAPESSKPSVDEPTSNGETEGSASGCSSSAPEVTSSSAVSTEVVGSSTSKEEPASSSSSPRKSKKEGSSQKKSDLATMMDSTITSDDEDSSNDEPFQPNEEVPSSSSDDDEEVHLNGSKDSEEDEDEDGEDDVEEESEEEDDDEEIEEEDEDFVVKGGPEEPGMDSGCTAVVALVTKDKLYVANAGDSRAVLCRSGTAVDLSIDHKPEDPIELKRIQNAGGKVTNDGRVNGGLNLSRALGDHFYKHSADLDAREQMITALPDIVTETIDRSVDEFIVLACDGIWNSMSSQEVVDFVRPLVKKGETLSSICEKLFEACLAPDTCGDGTGCDNMTCVIVNLLPVEAEAAVTNKRRSPDPEDEPAETQPESKKPKLSAEPES